MNQAGEVAARFDVISDIYDETREPLVDDAMDKVRDLLLRDGCNSIIEVGVGTGRIAKPLQERHFDLVGVDLSVGMLKKAKAKGVQGLVMADVNHLPARGKAFDAAIMAHVLHLLESPPDVFRSLASVSRKDVVVLVRKRDARPASGDALPKVREVYRRIAAEMGQPISDRRGLWRKKEADFLSNFPPDELVTVQDVVVDTTVGERLSFLEKRPYSWDRDIPDEVFRRAIQEVRSSVDVDKRIKLRRVEQAAIYFVNGNEWPGKPGQSKS